MKDKLLYIEWDDAASRGGWEPRSEVDNKPYRCRTAGSHVSETNDSVVVATNLSCNGKCSETMQIPKGMIRKRKTVGTYDRLDK